MPESVAHRPKPFTVAPAGSEGNQVIEMRTVHATVFSIDHLNEKLNTYLIFPISFDFSSLLFAPLRPATRLGELCVFPPAVRCPLYRELTCVNREE